MWTKGGEGQIDGIKRARTTRQIRDLDHAKEIKTKLEKAKQSKSAAAAAAMKKFKKKPCSFCRDKVTYIDYKDIATLRKYITDRGKIRSRRITGACTQHQRAVAAAVKNSREMALLPYTSTAR